MTSWFASGAMSYDDSTSSCSSMLNSSPQADPRPSESSAYRLADGDSMRLTLA